MSISVSDQCGGADQKKARLFSPFFEHKTDTSGLGLGLAMSKKANERHGGYIEFENRPGIGYFV